MNYWTVKVNCWTVKGITYISIIHHTTAGPVPSHSGNPAQRYNRLHQHQSAGRSSLQVPGIRSVCNCQAQGFMPNQAQCPARPYDLKHFTLMSSSPSAHFPKSPKESLNHKSSSSLLRKPFSLISYTYCRYCVLKQLTFTLFHLKAISCLVLLWSLQQYLEPGDPVFSENLECHSLEISGDMVTIGHWTGTGIWA